MGEALIVILLIAVVAAVVITSRNQKTKAVQQRASELDPVKKLAFEDITALGEELQSLDADMAGSQLDPGANADYQRALDAYEAAKTAGDRIQQPEDIKNITEILEDGRYAMACVRARVAGEPLPQRRPPCFFDPRHGLSVDDVAYTPPGGTQRDVPACALDAERVHAGAAPDSRMVMVGSKRVPYYEGGRAYQPYASGYFGQFSTMDFMFMGLMFGGLGGFDALGSIGEGLGDGMGSIGDGIGDMFDGFDF